MDGCIVLVSQGRGGGLVLTIQRGSLGSSGCTECMSEGMRIHRDGFSFVFARDCSWPRWGGVWESWGGGSWRHPRLCCWVGIRTQTVHLWVAFYDVYNMRKERRE